MTNMNNKLAIKAIFAVNGAKKIITMKVRGVLMDNLEHSHTNDLGMIFVHKVTRTKYIVKDNQVQVIK